MLHILPCRNSLQLANVWQWKVNFRATHRVRRGSPVHLGHSSSWHPCNAVVRAGLVKPVHNLWHQSFLFTLPPTCTHSLLCCLAVWWKSISQIFFFFFFFQRAPGRLQRTLVKLCNGSNVNVWWGGYVSASLTTDSCVLRSAWVCLCVWFRTGWCCEKNRGAETPFCAPQRINTHQQHSKSWRDTGKARRVGRI